MVQQPPDPIHLDLMKAMKRLPMNHRRAIVLHDLFGLTVPEIAEEIGAPEGSIRTWLHRGRAALRKSVDLSVSPSPVRPASTGPASTDPASTDPASTEGSTHG
jgi:hypothetical protein